MNEAADRLVNVLMACPWIEFRAKEKYAAAIAACPIEELKSLICDLKHICSGNQILKEFHEELLAIIEKVEVLSSLLNEIISDPEGKELGK